MLKEFGKTPAEWSTMDPHQRTFLEVAHDELLQRRAEARED